MVCNLSRSMREYLSWNAQQHTSSVVITHFPVLFLMEWDWNGILPPLWHLLCFPDLFQQLPQAVNHCLSSTRQQFCCSPITPSCFAIFQLVNGMPQPCSSAVSAVERFTHWLASSNCPPIKSSIISCSHLSWSSLTAVPTALHRFQYSLCLPASCILQSHHLVYAFLFTSLICTVHSLIHFFRFFFFHCQCSLLASMMVCFSSFHLSLSTFPFVLLFSKHFMMVSLMFASCRSFILKHPCSSPLVYFVVSILWAGSQDGDQYCLHSRLWYLGLIRSFSALLEYNYIILEFGWLTAVRCIPCRLKDACMGKEGVGKTQTIGTCKWNK